MNRKYLTSLYNMSNIENEKNTRNLKKNYKYDLSYMYYSIQNIRV